MYEYQRKIYNLYFFLQVILLLLTEICASLALPWGIHDQDELVSFYFGLGYTVKEIVGNLLIINHIIISQRTVKRILTRLSLRRRNENSLARIVTGITWLHRHGYSELGYRWIWKLLNMRLGIRAYQDTVRLVLRVMDSVGVNVRRRRRLRRKLYVNPGPNFLIHIDGYDKLKPYGISIHGAIDGFSRRIIWLKSV